MVGARDWSRRQVDDDKGTLDFPVHDAAKSALSGTSTRRRILIAGSTSSAKPDNSRRQKGKRTATSRRVARSSGRSDTAVAGVPTWPPLRWDNGLERALLGTEILPPIVGLQWPIAHWMTPLSWWYRGNRTLVLPDATGGREFDVESNDLAFWIAYLKDKTGLIKTNEVLGEFAIAWIAWEKWIQPQSWDRWFLPETRRDANGPYGIRAPRGRLTPAVRGQ